ncbi:LysR family transcriptional regulator [Caballeronia arationis]|jgi:DNA-binding transcriptional LysR family regulator|uniref:DNA-binding transcriptional regulator, LysR family n=2 Tax=Caballeronia arationis TaxID=1777142 RepID=A0A7Z7N0M5_9BURK|nr:LysR family transcriptional regulator [Caballeronia arationis]SOE54892.1 DNA-binding transcriptional regulator, LysR family [Caballeronia arationis]
MPSIRTLKIFLTVARCGTFSSAGELVGLTPAAIGLQIRTLEDELGVQLFDRSARAAVLNPIGRSLVPRVEEVLSQYELLEASVSGGEMSGTVVIGALVSALMGAFADALWSIRRRYPGLDVHLLAGMSSDFARKVEDGELDAAVVTQSPRPLPASLSWTPLYSEPMVLIVPTSPHFELPSEQIQILNEAPFMRFERSTWTGYLVEEVLKRCDAKVNEAMELNSIEAIIALVRQGFGISIVPKLANVAWDKDEALQLYSLDGVDIRRHVGLLERSKHGRMNFTEAIKKYFARN